MGLTPALGRPARLGRPRLRRPDGWTAATVVCALLVAGPLLGLPISFVAEDARAFSRFSGLLPQALESTALLLAGVGLGTLVLGTSLAALVSFFDFPGRGLVEWALVLPLAVPGYVFTLFALGTLPDGGAVLRSPLGAVVVFTLVLYPYV